MEKTFLTKGLKIKFDVRGQFYHDEQDSNPLTIREFLVAVIEYEQPELNSKK